MKTYNLRVRKNDPVYCVTTMNGTESLRYFKTLNATSCYSMMLNLEL